MAPIILFDSLQESLILQVDAGVLISDRVNHSALTFNHLHLGGVRLAKGLRLVELVRHVQSVILTQPAHSSRLNPGPWFWLHLFSGFMLHVGVPVKRIEPFDPLKLFAARDDNHASALVDVHQGLYAGAVEEPSVGHGVLVEFVLSVHLIDNF